MGYLLALFRAVAWIFMSSIFGLIGLGLYFADIFSSSGRLKKITVFTRYWARWTCFIFNIRFQVIGELKPDPGALIVSNHVGAPDIFILGSCFEAFYVSKAEIAHWPFVSSLARLGATIFADRTRRHQVKAVIDETRSRLQKGLSVVLFPEGWAMDGSDVFPFKPSLFEAAVLANRPVLPVAIIYHDNHDPSIACWYGINFFQHMVALLKNTRLDARVYILPKIQGEKNRRTLALKSHELIKEKFKAEKN